MVAIAGRHTVPSYEFAFSYLNGEHRLFVTHIGGGISLLKEILLSQLNGYLHGKYRTFLTHA
jgi:hypothetical protein